jgi:dihydroxyacetone kinase
MLEAAVMAGRYPVPGQNYTGDVMNFEMAAELAGHGGIEVASLLIDDDVVVENSLHAGGGCRSTNPADSKKAAAEQGSLAVLRSGAKVREGASMAWH